MSDDRDWSKYNDELVRRGEIELDASIMEEWKNELKKENEGKVGEPFHYPEAYIRLIAFVRLLFHLPYRQTEGFMILPFEVRRWTESHRLFGVEQEGEQAPGSNWKIRF